MCPFLCKLFVSLNASFDFRESFSTGVIIKLVESFDRKMENFHQKNNVEADNIVLHTVCAILFSLSRDVFARIRDLCRFWQNIWNTRIVWKKAMYYAFIGKNILCWIYQSNNSVTTSYIFFHVLKKP